MKTLSEEQLGTLETQIHTHSMYTIIRHRKCNKKRIQSPFVIISQVEIFDLPEFENNTLWWKVDCGLKKKKKKSCVF